MQHKDARVAREANDRGGALPQLGTGRSIRPRPTVPPTVLGTGMGNGSPFLRGWPDAASVYLRPSATVPLTQELAAALGSTELALRGDQGAVL